jgi:copper(I)-binding protein
MLRALASLFLCLVVGSGFAAPSATPAANVSIERPWARATPPGVQVGAAYAVIANQGPATDRLLKVTTPASARVEIHSTTQVAGRMQMRPVTELDVPAGARITFGPGGMHLMLVDLKAPLRAGTQLELTFVFEKAGAIAVQATVAPIGSSLPAEEDASHHAHH